MRVRAVSCNVGGLRAGVAATAALVRPLHPDLVVVQDGPWRLRWRTPTADLARSLGLFYAGGGKACAGNALLAGLRVRVDAVRTLRYPLVPGHALRGAVIARCTVGGASFTVAGTGLAPDARERAAQASLLAAELDRITGPLLLAGDLDDRAGGGAAWRLLAAGRVEAGAEERGGRADGGPLDGVPRGALLVGRGIEIHDFGSGDADAAGRRAALVEIVVPDAVPGAGSGADGGDGPSERAGAHGDIAPSERGGAHGDNGPSEGGGGDGAGEGGAAVGTQAGG